MYNNHDLPEWISPRILDTGASFGLPALNGVLNIGNTMLQNYYNKQMAQYQNDYNLEMWNKQNEYNSPKETMNRLVEAGINPRAYQQLGQFANAGQPQPAAQRNKVAELSAFQGVVKQGLENKMLSEELKQMQMQTRRMDLEYNRLGTLYQQDMFKSSKILFDIFYDAVKHGVNPNRLSEGYGNFFRQHNANGAFDELINYVESGKKPRNPYLLSAYLQNEMLKRGISLREIEESLKLIEKKDYEEYGIRGNSDFINTVRGVVNFIKNIF